MNQIGGGQTRRRLELALTWFHLTFDIDIVARARASGCVRARTQAPGERVTAVGGQPGRSRCRIACADRRKLRARPVLRAGLKLCDRNLEATLNLFGTRDWTQILVVLYQIKLQLDVSRE